MEKKPHPKPTNPPTTMRLPGPLREELVQTAAKHGHSMNDEVILRLTMQPIEARLAVLEQQAAELKRMLQVLIDRQS